MQNRAFWPQWRKSCLAKNGTAYDVNNTIPTVKHGGGNMIWCCFSFNGVRTLEIIDGGMHGVKYRQILEDNLQESAEKMGLINDWWLQQDNDPQHTARATEKWFADKDIDVLK